jgi:hypothetical protein
MKKICDVFKSKRVQGMYLYVEKAQGLEPVPDILLDKFGPAQHVMTLLIKPEQALSLVSGERVLAGISERGFYLQMPPQDDQHQREIAAKNSKLSSGQY